MICREFSYLTCGVVMNQKIKKDRKKSYVAISIITYTYIYLQLEEFFDEHVDRYLPNRQFCQKEIFQIDHKVFSNAWGQFNYTTLLLSPIFTERTKKK